MNIDEIILDKYAGENISMYATSEFIDDFIHENDIELDEDSDDIYILDDYDYAVLSRIILQGKECWFLERMIYDNGEQYFNECKILFVEGSVMDVVNLDKIEFEEILIFTEETDESEDDDLDNLLEKVTEDLLNEIEEGECPHCSIKKYLKIVWDTSRDVTIDDIHDCLDEIYK